MLYSAAKKAGCDTAPGLVLLRGAAEGGGAAARGVRCAVLLTTSPLSARGTRVFLRAECVLEASCCLMQLCSDAFEAYSQNFA